MWAGSVSMGTIDGGTSSSLARSLAQPGVVVQVCTRTVRAARAVQYCTCSTYVRDMYMYNVHKSA